MWCEAMAAGKKKALGSRVCRVEERRQEVAAWIRKGSRAIKREVSLEIPRLLERARRL